MRLRFSLLWVLVIALVGEAPLWAANLDGSSPAEGDAEAARLLAEASDYVNNMAEGQYSYSYLQFYWKRAQSNLDRIRQVYRSSPTARTLQADGARIGPFPLAYFRDRVLYNLEAKRLGAFDDVNCAIFLYGRDENRTDPKRDEALGEIIEVLARRQRWGEAARFPVLPAHRAILQGAIFRVAAFYGVEDVLKRMLAKTPPAEQAAAHFDALMAEGLALRGRPRDALLAFVNSHPADEVRVAALRGVVERELLIRRMARLKIPVTSSIQTVHLVVQNLGLRDDVRVLGQQIFGGNLDAAKPLLAEYTAGLGTAPERSAPAAAHLAYMQYLADSGRLDAVATYPTDSDASGLTLRATRLKVIELLAQDNLDTNVALRRSVERHRFFLRLRDGSYRAGAE